MASPQQNALLGLASNTYTSPANTLMPPSPYNVTPAQGMQANAQAVGNFLAQQRAQSAAMGLMDPATGLPTRAGLMNAAGQYGNALMMGTTEPGAPPVNGLMAYHGSPHSFDRFSLDKIGTGEGNAAYGHGLYFAGNEATAKAYRDQLAGKNRSLEWDGAPVASGSGFSNLVDGLQNQDWRLAKIVEKAGQYSPGQAMQMFQGELRNSDGPLWQAALDKFQEGAGSSAKGHMYQVEINANPEHFLDWDRPLSDQHPVVQDALASHLEPYRQQLVADSLPSWRDPTPDELAQTHAQANDAIGAMRGSQAYDKIAGNDPAAASQALQASGVPGLRYLDQGSRGNDGVAGDASHNLVVFNDQNINVLKKYGIAGLGIGGAAAAQSQAPAAGSDQSVMSQPLPAQQPQ